MIVIDQLKENLTFAYQDSEYKREKLVIELECPLNRDTMTGVSLLGYVLGAATDKHQDIVSLSRYLDELFGGSVYVSSSRVGKKMLMHFDIDTVCGEYVMDHTIGIKAAALLCEIICDPYLINGAFDKDIVSVEKEKLREEIRFIINNKEEYCSRMLLKKFFHDSERSLPSLGFEEDIDRLNERDLYDIYYENTRNCNIRVFYCGRNKEEIMSLITDVFNENGIGDHPVTLSYDDIVKLEEPFRIEENVGTEQEIYSMVFHSGKKESIRDLAALKVANAIFGGMPTSRLFTVIREKLGLCYSCVSNRMTAGGLGILIEGSTSHDRFERNYDAIQEEFNKIQKEYVTAGELDAAKLSIINALKSVTDTVSGVSSHYFASINSIGRYIPPDQEIDLIAAVSEEDVRNCFKELSFRGISILTNE